jgi:hypothetical protein
MQASLQSVTQFMEMNRCKLSRNGMIHRSTRMTRSIQRSIRTVFVLSVSTGTHDPIYIATVFGHDFNPVQLRSSTLEDTGQTHGRLEAGMIHRSARMTRSIQRSIRTVFVLSVSTGRHDPIYIATVFGHDFKLVQLRTSTLDESGQNARLGSSWKIKIRCKLEVSITPASTRP